MYKELELYRILSRIYLAFNCELLENGNYGILTCADNYFRQKYLQTEYLIKQQAIKYGINIEASMMLSNYDGQITYVPQIHFMDLNNSINIDRQSINYIKDKIIRICPNIWACEKKSVNSANLSFLWYTKKILKELKYGTKEETSTQSSNDGG